MANGKKPFKDKKFYLDLRFYRHQDELVKNLKKLGGRVESFLSRDVTHVITDRPNLALKQEPLAPGTPKSLRSSPRNVNSYDSVLGHFETPVNTSSSSVETVSTPALSRGLALVQKAKQKHQGTTDLLGVCSQWDIKVVQLKKVLSFITKLHLCSSKNAENHQPKVHPKDNIKCVPEKLTPPFIKIEDQKKAYKPNYKVFKTWKDVCDPTIWRIANQLKTQIQESKERSALRPSQLQNILNNDSAQSPSRDSTLSVLPSPGQSQVAMSLGTSSKMATIPVNYSTDKIKKDLNVSKTKGKTQEKAAPKKRYCEICLCTFTKLEEHIVSKKHRDFVNNSSNFLILKRIIATLPSTYKFLKKHQCELPDEQELLKPPVLEKVIPIIKKRFESDRKKPTTKEETSTQGKNCEKQPDKHHPDAPKVVKSSDNDEIIPASCSTDKLTPGSSETVLPLANIEDAKVPDSVPGVPDSVVNVYFDTPACPENLGMDENLTVINYSEHISYDGNVGLDEYYNSMCENNYLYGPINVSNGLDAAVLALESQKHLMMPDTSHIIGFCELGYTDDYGICTANVSLEHGVENMPGDGCSIIRTYPFTNFGYGWSGNSVPGGDVCGENCSSNAVLASGIMGLNGNNHFKITTEDTTKEKNSDFLLSSDSVDNWKDIQSEINNVCQSLNPYEDTAMDLSIKMTEVSAAVSNPRANEPCPSGCNIAFHGSRSSKQDDICVTDLETNIQNDIDDCNVDADLQDEGTVHNPETDKRNEKVDVQNVKKHKLVAMDLSMKSMEDNVSIVP